MRSTARLGLSSALVLAMLLPIVLAAGSAIHAIDHDAVGGISREVAALAAHGHTHPVVTPAHDHGAPLPAATAPLAEPAFAGTVLVARAAETESAGLRAASPRSRGSGDDLLLRLSCVLLL